MGLGDAKPMASVGRVRGVRPPVLTSFGAPLVGSLPAVATILNVWMKRHHRRRVHHREPTAVARRRAWRSARMVYRHYEMPFGVFLGVMAILALFFGNDLLRWYWGLYR